MEKILLFKKKIVRKENDEEFYLNPRDIFIKGEILSDSATLENFHYLPLNELIVILFNDFISVLDIKESITYGMKIVKQINYKFLFEENFMSQISEELKIIKKKNKKDSNQEINSIMNFNNSDDSNKIRNLVVFESRLSSYSINFIIEYINHDMLMIKYDDKCFEKYRTILKISREHQIYTLLSQLNSKTKNNPQISEKDFSNKNSFVKDSSFKYINLNTHNIQFSNIEQKDLCERHLIAYKLNNIICLGTMTLYVDNHSNNNFNFTHFHKGKGEIVDFMFKTHKTNLLLIQVTPDYELVIDTFECIYITSQLNKSKKGAETELNLTLKFSQNLTLESNAFINFMDIITMSDKLLLVIVKVNKLFIFTLSLNESNNEISSKNNFMLSHIYLFQGLANSLIKHVFLLKDYLFIFNKKGNYAFEKLQFIGGSINSISVSSNSSNFTINQQSKNLILVKTLFCVRQFHSGLGFFILGSSNFIRSKDFCISYFLPKILTIETTNFIEILNESSKPIYYYISSCLFERVHKVFFTFCLSEFLVLTFRNNVYLSDLLLIDMNKIKSLNKTNELLFNDYLMLLIKRILVYATKIEILKLDEVKHTDDENIFDSKSYIIHQFRSLLSDSIDDHNDSYEYGEYINNPLFTCEFCESIYSFYNEEKRIYVCEKNNHFTMSCCISFAPVNDSELFFICEECDLIYKENCFYIVLNRNHESAKLNICLVCQKNLQEI